MRKQVGSTSRKEENCCKTNEEMVGPDLGAETDQ